MGARFAAAGLFRRERQTLVRLFGASLVGLLAFLVVAMAVSGALAGMVEPIQHLVTGDSRVTMGESAGLARGPVFEDAANASRPLQGMEGASVDARFETMYVTVEGVSTRNWSAGLLLGVDPDSDSEQDAIGPYVKQGRFLNSSEVVDPDTGEVYTPLVIGTSAARNLGIPRGEPLDPFNRTLTISSGHAPGTGAGLPVTLEAVVVGLHRSGLEQVDQFTAFAPIEKVRALEGHAPADPSGNALVVRGAPADAVEERYEAAGVEADAKSPTTYAVDNLGGVLLFVYGALALDLVVLAGLLLAGLAYLLDSRLRDQQPQVATLLSVGISPRTILGAYVATYGATVALASVAALALGGAWAVLAPDVTLTLGTVTGRVAWTLKLWHAALVLALGLVVAPAACWLTARRRVRGLDLREALRTA